MSRKDTIDALFAKKPLGAPNTGGDADKDRVRTGAISAMGASLQQLNENAKTVTRLQDQLQNGDSVVSIDPSQVDDSFISDRLDFDKDPSFDALVQSIAASGQEVPILVRPHPDHSDRYQVAYGHRRLRAARKLGIKVRAIVRALNDASLVVAQGKENLDRKDLSFIEKALFASRLEDRGFDRAVIVSALASDKADVSRYISIARSVPEPVIQHIGPADKAGRARWIALSDRLAQPNSQAIIAELFVQSDFKGADSNTRFSMVFTALSSEKKVKPTMKSWTSRSGRKVARIERVGTNLSLHINEKSAPNFGQYLVDHLSEIFEQFEQDVSLQRAVSADGT